MISAIAEFSVRRRDAARIISDNLPFISATSLGKSGRLADGMRAELITTLTSGLEHHATIQVRRNTATPQLTVKYIPNGNEAGRRIQLRYTPCRYGGHRWWLACPLCNRRCGKLYLLYGEYGCIRCHNLTYKSRLVGRKTSLFSTIQTLQKISTARRELATLKRTKYRGRPTRKFRRLLKLVAAVSGQPGGGKM